MNEAKGVWWANYLDVQGNKHSFTLRQEDAQSDKDFILRVKQFELDLAAGGFSGLVISGIVKDGASYKREQTGNFDKSVKTELKSVEVKSIALASGGDHPRWIVKGGAFVKFGITCWPEVLERAGILNKLDPLKDNEPGGKWLAMYQEKQNNEGKTVPDRVVSLEKVS